MIIEFRIKRIVYLWEHARKPKTRAAMEMFHDANVMYRYWLFRIIDLLLENRKIFVQSCFFSFRQYNSRKIEINFYDIIEKTEKKEEEGESSSRNTEE